jgi:hypothetical protein
VDGEVRAIPPLLRLSFPGCVTAVAVEPAGICMELLGLVGLAPFLPLPLPDVSLLDSPPLPLRTPVEPLLPVFRRLPAAAELRLPRLPLLPLFPFFAEPAAPPGLRDLPLPDFDLPLPDFDLPLPDFDMLFFDPLLLMPPLLLATGAPPPPFPGNIHIIFFFRDCQGEPTGTNPTGGNGLNEVGGLGAVGGDTGDFVLLDIVRVVGDPVELGFLLGDWEGTLLGIADKEGPSEGNAEGTRLGAFEGEKTGVSDGDSLGDDDGSSEGDLDGKVVGFSDGKPEGKCVGS